MANGQFWASIILVNATILMIGFMLMETIRKGVREIVDAIRNNPPAP
ncbi:MAG: hypothetical protein ACT4OE_09870 [Sphingosinicella sp.]